MAKPKELLVVAFIDSPIRIQWITRKGHIVSEQVLDYGKTEDNQGIPR